LGNVAVCGGSNIPFEIIRNTLRRIINNNKEALKLGELIEDA